MLDVIRNVGALVMSGSYLWVGSDGSDWGVATNWDPAQVPTPGSVVEFDGASVTHNLNHKESIAELQLIGSLAMAAGSIVARHSSIGDESISLTGGSFTVQNIDDAQDVNIEIAGGAVSLANGSIYLWSGQEIHTGALGTLTLKSVDVIDQARDDDPTFNLPQSHVQNDGALVTKGQTHIETYFTNNGTAEIDGSLWIAGSSDDAGSYSGGGTLHLGAFVVGYHLTSADSARTIAGPVSVAHVVEEGTDLTLNGNYSATTTEVSLLAYDYFDGDFHQHYSGSMTFNASYESGKTSVDPGGVVTFNSDATTGALSVKGGVVAINPDVVPPDYLDGTIIANAALTVTGATQLQGAVFGGDGTVELDGATKVTKELVFQASGLDFENHGTMTFSGKASVLFQDAPSGQTFFLNEAGGTINLLSDIRFSESDSGGAPASTIENDGLFEKTAGKGTAEIDVAFVNNGTIEVDSGTLWLKGGLSGSGDVVIHGGTLLVGPGATPFAVHDGGGDFFLS
jgi:hypothetical protein